MIDQQLYVDGELMDITEDTSITLDIKSNLFNDVGSMESSRSYTVKIPKTIHNLSVLGHCDKPKSSTRYPFIFHVCRYFRNGVEIISNGRVNVMSVNETIELAIYWGLLPRLTTLQENETKLNELETDKHVLYSKNNTVMTYVDAVAEGVFYASYNPYRDSDNADDWQGQDNVIIFDDILSRAGSFGNSGGVFGNSTIGTNPIQPCVTCKWLLSLITTATGVSFSFPTEEKAYIDTLAIPLISRTADEQTIVGALEAKIKDTTALGLLSFTLSDSTTSFNQQAGTTATQLDVKTACELKLDVAMTWSWDASKVTPQGYRHWTDENGLELKEGYYNYWGNYIEIKIVSKHDASVTDENQYTAYYYVGKAQRDSDGKITNDTVTDVDGSKVDGKFIHKLTGSGKISLEAGDVITFTMQNQKGTLTGLKCYNGTISASLIDSGEVPYGGMFPIGKNLPDVKVLDYIKFLSLITGTFPRQSGESDSVEFVTFDEVWQNRDKAINWSKKLIASEARNTPRSVEFSVGSYCRLNHYKWAEDDTVKGDYDADLVIDNDTLEYEQDVWTLPFAASDGNQIPFLTPPSIDISDRTSLQSVGDYNACKDRIMTLCADNDKKAALRFDIDLKAIFETKYSKLVRTISRAKVIKEYLYLSDFDILGFDETIPIYLAQYGAYFAVTELKVTDSGYTEATMIQLEF